MIKIDAMGQMCPTPIIRMKSALRQNPSENSFEILVDNEVTTQNLKKMAKELNIDFNVEKIENKKYIVKYTKTNDSLAESKIESFRVENITKDDYVVIISSDEMGVGDSKFSKTLLEGFIYALTEQDKLPSYVAFYNKGVTLTTLNEKTIEDIKSLEDRGVRILSCGLCLGNYNLKDKLKVGEITNLYKITELMRTYHVVKP